MEGRKTEREMERKARSTPVATVIINTSNAGHPSCLGLLVSYARARAVIFLHKV